jgi:enterochelin esterase-like enzyme
VGRVEQRKYQSLLLEKEIWLSVYIPACYEYDDKVRYPVLYLLHGQAYTDDQWIRLGAIEVANKFIREGKRRSFLMVMPYEENYLQSNDDSKFTQVIFEELIPWVDVNFHTCPEKKCRSIAGISRGAGWAIRVGLSHPELFESIATHSLPVSTRDIMQISKLLNGIMVDDLPRIWLDSGRSDLFLPGARLFEEVLMENQIPHEFYIYSGYHDEEYWQVHTEDYILWSTLAWN